MQSLAIDGSNSRKRKLTIIGFCHAVHLSNNFIFIHARTKHLSSRNMHISCYVACTFYLSNFFSGFIITLADNRTDKRYRAFLTRWRYSQPIHQFQLMFGTIRRQIVDSLPLLHTLMQIIHNCSGRQCMFNSYKLTFLLQCWLNTHPDDIINRQFITKNNFFIIVYINYSRKAGKPKTEIIKEGRILTVTESITFII